MQQSPQPPETLDAWMEHLLGPWAEDTHVREMLRSEDASFYAAAQDALEHVRREVCFCLFFTRIRTHACADRTFSSLIYTQENQNTTHTSSLLHDWERDWPQVTTNIAGDLLRRDDFINMDQLLNNVDDIPDLWEEVGENSPDFPENPRAPPASPASTSPSPPACTHFSPVRKPTASAVAKFQGDRASFCKEWVRPNAEDASIPQEAFHALPGTLVDVDWVACLVTVSANSCGVPHKSVDVQGYYIPQQQEFVFDLSMALQIYNTSQTPRTDYVRVLYTKVETLLPSATKARIRMLMTVCEGNNRRVLVPLGTSDVLKVYLEAANSVVQKKRRLPAFALQQYAYLLVHNPIQPTLLP